jgi:hypothetical protein
LKWLIKTYDYNKQRSSSTFFYKLAGTRKLQQQIEDGKSEADIRKSWETGLESSKNELNIYILKKHQHCFPY